MRGVQMKGCEKGCKELRDNDEGLMRNKSRKRMRDWGWQWGGEKPYLGEKGRKAVPHPQFGPDGLFSLAFAEQLEQYSC